MESWLVYTILAYFLWAITSIMDKVFLSKYFKSPIVYCVFGGLIQLVVLFAIPFFGFSHLPVQELILGLAAGALFFVALLPYFKALSQDDATIVVPLGSLTPLLVLLASFVFLGEQLGKMQWAAFGLFMAGGLLLSIKDVSVRKLRFTPSLKWVFLSMVLFSVALILTKRAFENIPFFEGFVLLRVGTFMAALGFFSKKEFRKLAKEALKGLRGKAKMAFAANQGFGILGQFLFNMAIAAGSLSLINAAQGIQYVFLFGISIVISAYFPRIFREEMDKGDLARRSVAIVFIAAAIYAVNV